MTKGDLAAMTRSTAGTVTPLVPVAAPAGATYRSPRPTYRAEVDQAELGPLAAVATPVQFVAGAPILMEGADATHLSRP
ncbi:MAG: hypothetical protein HY060_23520 [Proteobacteria bacterium]|nr:hypothetical protein [Pseudomonadota bacterium]